MGDIRDTFPEQDALSWGRSQAGLAPGERVGVVVSVAPGVTHVTPATPGQGFKQYESYHIGTYDRRALSLDSEVAIRTHGGRHVTIAETPVAINFSDVYTDGLGGFYRGHQQQGYYKSDETIGHGVTLGRGLWSIGENKYVASGTYKVGVGKFTHFTKLTPAEVTKVKAAIAAAKKAGYTLDAYGIFSPPDNPECFLAGTPVSMWPLDVKPDANGKYDQKEVQAKVWTKPIEEVTPEDLVVSYDDDGLLIPGRVTQTFKNRSKHILDVPVPQFDKQGRPDSTFKSLMVTPGHVTFCAPVEGGDNPFAGKHVPIIDILRSDGALKMLDGTLVRAATGAVVGSHDDKQFWAHIFERTPDGSIREREKKMLRLGTRWIEPDGTSITMREHMDSIGVELIEEGQFKGYTCLKGKGPVTGFEWKFSPSLPKPEDYILQRSALTSEEVYEADEWESVRPQMPAPVAGEAGRSFKRDNTLYAGDATAANDHLPPNIPHSMRNSPNQPTMNRQQRRALGRKQQKANSAKMRNAAKVSKPVAATVH